VLIEATVKDHAGHSESRGEPITVSDSPILITAVPEGGAIVPNLENQVFILTSYPDGTPAQTDLRVHIPNSPDMNVRTDKGGVVCVPVGARPVGVTLQIEASDREGNHTTKSAVLQARTGLDQILLRTSAVCIARASAFTCRYSRPSARVAPTSMLLRMVKPLPRTMWILWAARRISTSRDAGMAGTVEFNAYLFGANAIPVADHRLVSSSLRMS